MGLDITAYRKLEVVENPERDEDGDFVVDWETQFHPGGSMDWSEKHFPGRGEGIESDKVYTYEDEFSFRAGGYSGYNLWRSQLEQFKGEVAFQELIDFADNEGVIGPVVSKKLAKDFAKHETAAIQFAKILGDRSEFWLDRYQDWKTAFEFASDNGAVNFC